MHKYIQEVSVSGWCVREGGREGQRGSERDRGREGDRERESDRAHRYVSTRFTLSRAAV